MKAILYPAALAALLATAAQAQPAPGAGVGVSPDTGAASAPSATNPASADANPSPDGVLAPRSGTPTGATPPTTAAPPKSAVDSSRATITDGKSMARGDAASAVDSSVNTAATITVGQKLRTEGGQELGQVVDVQNSPSGEPTRVIVETADKKRRNVPTAGLKVEHGGVVTNHTAAQVQALPEATP